MSYYYKYEFVSPEPIYAQIKLELAQYFATGEVDDLLFPKWTDDCLKKLGKSSLSIQETILHIDTFQDKVPQNFDSVREAWWCNPGRDVLYPRPSYEYRECISSAIKVSDSSVTDCNPCGDGCHDVVKVMYKFVDTDVIHYYGRSHLLKPGNIATKSMCHTGCPNVYSNSSDVFDIHGNKFTTNFREGIVHLVYYAKDYDENGYQLMPDDVDMENYIKEYIKWKLFDQMYNQASIDTYRQASQRLDRQEMRKNEAWILADISRKKETIQKKQLAKKRVLNANNPYELADARPKRRY